DPIYGCVGFISYLHTRLKQIQAEALAAKKELAAYIGPQAMMMMVQAYRPFPAPAPASAVHIPPSLAIQVPAASANPNLAFRDAADHHLLL
ncbi:LOB domain containing-protein, partial [Escherichia coli]|nr:LOB domain containing-protein [Escherichia coli]